MSKVENAIRGVCDAVAERDAAWQEVVTSQAEEITALRQRCAELEAEAAALAADALTADLQQLTATDGADEWADITGAWPLTRQDLATAQDRLDELGMAVGHIPGEVLALLTVLLHRRDHGSVVIARTLAEVVR